MPFLMKVPSTLPDPAETACEIAHGTAALVHVTAGQLLTVMDIEGNRAAQLFALTEAEPREFLSPHHTRVFSNSYRLTLGMRLVTNRRRPIMVLGRDGGSPHDLLMPGSTRESLSAAGLREEAGSGELLRDVLRRHDIRAPKHPDPVNLFLDAAVEQSGALVPRATMPRAGRAVTCRVLIDAQVIVAAAANDLGIAGGRGPLSVRVHNHL